MKLLCFLLFFMSWIILFPNAILMFFWTCHIIHVLHFSYHVSWKLRDVVGCHWCCAFCFFFGLCLFFYDTYCCVLLWYEFVIFLVNRKWFPFWNCSLHFISRSKNEIFRIRGNLSRNDETFWFFQTRN
jgi:hypothetical protein